MATMSLLWLIFQVAPAGPGPTLNDIAHFDLAKLPHADVSNCKAGVPADEILVCGRRPVDPPRLDLRFEDKPWQPRLHIAGAEVTPEAEQRTLPGGYSGPAAMIRFKWKF
ncbi:hypothetical protein ACLB0R_03585 [Sphingomonas sp. GlSt437]